MLASVTALVEEIQRNRLLPAAELAELATHVGSDFPDPRALARELMRRGWLTPYQVNQLFLGRGSSLVLGQYILLERLGEGGMGQVFKARHQALRRLVALKVLRKDHSANAEAVQRFEREVRAAARVSHANIVLAFDANRVGNTIFLVMEYVDGVDLSRLVKQSGPLPVAHASDYVRQAALALQHAHEHGMVHRDVKPSNLLLTPPPSVPLPPGKKGRTVKLLDLGVVRMPRRDDEPTDTLTQFGMVMGTPDYIAPEQARNAHQADIRSDLYGLGCTFYFLLTGKAPFPGGSLTEKLLRHQLDAAPPVEQLRPEMPADLVAVVRKLMAKRPADRYQIPADLLAALASLAEVTGPPTPVGAAADASAEEPTAVTASAGPPPPGQLSATQMDSTEIAWASVVSTKELPRPSAVRRLPRSAGIGPWTSVRAGGRGAWVVAGGAGVLVGLLFAVVAFLVLKAEKQPPQPTTVSCRVEANRPWQDTGVAVVAGTPVTIRAVAGTWRKGRAACDARGFPEARRDRAVVAEAPLMCLLARVGSDGIPIAVGREKQFVPQHGGRIFVQTNDLDLDGNRGSLELEIEAVIALREGG